MTLSVIIITKNEEKNIANCLESVKWADEIIVVDVLSQDNTVEIAKRYTDKIYFRKWTTFEEQRSFALSLGKCDFILILDADEILDEELVDEIKKILRSEEDYDGYFIMIQVYFLGRPLFYSQRPSPHIRLFRKDKGFVVIKPGQRAHEYYGVHGNTRLIGGKIQHCTAHTVAERLEKVNRYSYYWAEERAEHGNHRYLPAKAVFFLIKSFVGNYFIRRGFLDGFPGFIWCALKALENFLNYAKLREKIKP